MSKKTHNNTAFDSEQDKGKERSTQEQRLRAYLRQHTVSRLMAAEALGIRIQSVCYAVGRFRKADAVAVVRKGRCSISGEWVEYITTDTDKFPKANLKPSRR